jgi:hypothetical protein
MGTFEQVSGAYRRMAAEARYRPDAPSDGMGNIVVPEAELMLDDEAAAFARRWMRNEEDDAFNVGYPDVNARPALVFTIEAARLTCGTAYEPAAKLLRMAADELEQLAAQRRAEEDELGS